MPTLEKELETYRKERDGLLKDAGKFVLIHGDKVVSVWSSYEDALQAGYQQFKHSPFLVKQIEVVEHVNFCTRSVQGNRT
jgi:hypothetical protein